MLTRAQTSRKRSQVEADIAQQQERATKTTKLSAAASAACTPLFQTPNKLPKAASRSSPSATASLASGSITASPAALLTSPSKRRHRRRTELADLKANAASLRHSTTQPHHIRRLTNKSPGRLFSLAITSPTHPQLCRLAVHWSDTVWRVKERVEQRLGECVVWQQLWMDRNGWKRMEDEWSMAECFERPEDAVVRLKIVEPSW